jgi:DDE superfamily endonuclease
LCPKVQILNHNYFCNDAGIISGNIIAANLNAPGSWHDSRVAQPIYEKLRTRTPEGFYLVADTAFPRGAKQIEGKIRAPIKSGQRMRGTVEEIQQRVAFDRELLSYRQTAEWGMRGLQGSFGRLRIPLEIGRQDERGDLLEICVRLNNLRAELVGINQIRSVYMPLWKQTREDEEVWGNFENILFGEQRRSDRVARFHNIAVYD